MDKESKYKAMTEQLKLTNSKEEVANYLLWIIKSDVSKEYWAEIIKDELLKQIMPVVHYNGYRIEAVPKSTIISLPSLMRTID